MNVSTPKIITIEDSFITAVSKLLKNTPYIFSPCFKMDAAPVRGAMDRLDIFSKPFCH